MRATFALLMTMTLVGCGTAESRAGAKRVTLVPASDASFGAAYSRDGRLAFNKVVGGKSAIFVANADATDAKRVSFGVWDSGPMWSPDGKSIALQRDAGFQSDVVIVPADSGAELVVAGTSTDERCRGWLPDGSGILFVRVSERGGEPWVYRLADRSSTKLFDVDGSVVDVALSPDGKWIAYTLTKGGKSTIWVWDRATKAHRQLTTEGFEVAGFESFSPDGRTILYESRRTGTSDLWRVDVATGVRQQLTQDVAGDVNGKWSPDGSRIAFTSNRGGQPDLWVLSTGEGDVERVTDDAANEGLERWAPDGHSILALVPPGQTHLYSMPLAGGPAAPLTSGDWQVGAAELSRDGSRIAYVGTKNGDADIWMVPVTGGESRLVSGAPGADNQPALSPDATQIAFTSVRSGNRDIWTVSVDSGGSGTPRQLTNWPSGESSAEWAPDGKTIAFLSSRESSGADIWMMPAAGGAPRRLTRLGTIGGFRWSRDGRSLAYSAQSGAGAGEAVFTVPAIGGVPRLLFPPTSSDPQWSPDGSELSVTKCTRGYCVVEVRSSNGTLPRTLGSGGDVYEYGAKWSHDGKQVLVASQDLTSNAIDRAFLRPASGGPGRQLQGPAGSAVIPVGFAAGDGAAVVIGVPFGVALQQISVRAPARAP